MPNIHHNHKDKHSKHSSNSNNNDHPTYSALTQGYEEDEYTMSSTRRDYSSNDDDNDDDEDFEETATGTAQFIGSNSANSTNVNETATAPPIRESSLKRAVTTNSSDATRRARMASTPGTTSTSTSTGMTGGLADNPLPLRRANTADNPTSTSTTTTSSAKRAVGVASQYMRKGVSQRGFPTTQVMGIPASTGDLLGEHSDLSDPDLSEDDHSDHDDKDNKDKDTPSSLPSKAIMARTSAQSAGTHTSMPRRESYKSTESDPYLDSLLDSTSNTNKRTSEGSVSNIFDSPNKKKGDKPSFAHIPRVDRTGRLRSLNLNDSFHSRNPTTTPTPTIATNDSTPLQNTLSFLRGLWNPATPKEGNQQQQLGSTILASLGDKYQPDQSFNLKDAQHLDRQVERQKQKRRQSRKSIKNLIFGDISQFEDVDFLGEQSEQALSQQKRRRSVMLQLPNNHNNSNKAATDNHHLKCCGWHVIMVVIVIFGIWALIYSLVFDGSLQGADTHSTSIPSAPPTLAPSQAVDDPTTTTANEDNPTQEADEEEQAVVAALAEKQINQTIVNLASTTTTTTATSSSETQPQQQQTVVLSTANQERWKDLVGLIVRSNITPRQDFNDPASSAYKALDWMVEYDQAADMEVISSDTAVHTLETYALIVFYFATHPSVTSAQSASEMMSSFSTRNSLTSTLLEEEEGHNWVQQTKSKCHWEGVSCGHLHNVVQLDVSHSHLAGTLPPELLALEHLHILNLNRNSIGGTLPEEWPEAWPHAKNIDLSYNRLEGPVPQSWNEFWIDDNPDVTVDLTHNENLEAE